MTNEKINIVVCDDHKLFRKGMCALLEDFDNVNEIDEAGNGVELLELLSSGEAQPHLILLDINMPEMDGSQAAKIIKKKYPNIKIVVLSMEDDTQLVSHMVNLGVNGYLLKNADPDELEMAIKLVLKNDFYFSGSLSNAVLKSSTTKKVSKDEGPIIELSERELQILELTCKELTAAEVGEKMLISARTVEGLKRKLLLKTNTKSIAGLVIFAIKNNLVEI